VRSAIARLVDQESLTLATTHVFLLSAIVFVFAAGIIWFTPRPRGKVDTSAAH
jgi:MFS transporter, DHA2 family, multidrug resistance protein